MPDVQDTVNLKDFLLVANERDDLRAKWQAAEADAMEWAVKGDALRAALAEKQDALIVSDTRWMEARAEIARLEEKLTAAERSAREMHIAADNFLRELDALRAENKTLQAECDQWQKKLTEDAWPEIERLRAALVQIENWAGKLPSNLGEAALVFDYIEKAATEALAGPKRA